MPTLGIELADVGFAAAVASGQAAPEEIKTNDGVQGWPGFAYFDGQKLHFGRAAEDLWFVHPRSVNYTFWSKLTHEPSTLGTVGERMPSYSELSFHFLRSFLQQQSIAAVRPLEKVILAVPGAYLKEQATEEERIGLLLGMANELKLPLCGIIDMALAALCDPRAAGFNPNLPVIVVDVQLLQGELTLFTQGEKLERKRFLHLPQSGFAQLLKHINAAIGNRFLRHTAFDILADGRLEQTFYRQTKDFLVSGASEYRFQINTERRNYEMLAKQDQLTADAANFCASLVQSLQSFARDSGAAANLCTIALTARAALLPGIESRLRSAGFTRVLRLPSAAAAAGAATYAAASLPVPTDLTEVPVLRRIPGAISRRAPSARWEAHLHKSPSVSPRPAPTHVVLDGIGHPLNGGRFTVGSAQAQATLALPDSFNQADDCVVEFVRDGGRFWFLDSSAQGSAASKDARTSVEAGDRVRIQCGQADTEIIFVYCEEPSSRRS